MLELNINLREIFSLTAQIDRGELAIPEFQREFIWRPKDIADFMRTIARSWPAGRFLLLEGPQDFLPKPIDGAPALVRSPKLLVLDGQQRVTSIYQVLREQAQESYYIKLKDVLSKGSFEDDHLIFMRNDRYFKSYPTMKKEALERVIRISTLADDRQFEDWKNFCSDIERAEYAGVRQDHLRGLTNYRMPCVTLPSDTPLPALAKIFETINRTGVRLDVFDLMVAKLYPHDFKLKDRYAESKRKFNILSEFNVEGLDILRLIALREHLKPSQMLSGPGGSKPVRIKGIRQSDVLELRPDVVIQNWNDAARVYAETLHFLQQRCGVAKPYLLPAETIAITLGYVFWDRNQWPNHADESLCRWFWATVFTQSYAQGANTQAITDAKALEAWLVNSESVPTVVRSFEVDTEAFMDNRRRNEMFVLGLSCLIVSHDGRDWVTARPLREASKLEIHHIFPSEHLHRIGVAQSDLVGNLTPIDASTNSMLRNTSPTEVAARNDVSRQAIESHAVSYEDFRLGAWGEFLDKRAVTLTAWIRDAVRRDS